METITDRGIPPKRSTKIIASITAAVSLGVVIFLWPALEESFTVHMIDHMILIGVFAPSLLAADFFLWWLPAGVLEDRAAFRAIRRGLYAISYPAVAFILSTAVLWFWHIPIPYDVTLTNMPVHHIEHISLVIVFLAYWAPLIPGSRLRLPFLKTTEGKALYIIAGAMQGMILGVIITFQDKIIYAYPSIAHMPGITLLSDQQTGGAVMWFFGAAIYGVAAILAFRFASPDTRKDILPVGGE